MGSAQAGMTEQGDRKTNKQQTKTPRVGGEERAVRLGQQFPSLPQLSPLALRPAAAM